MGLLAEKSITVERTSIFYLSDLGWDSKTHSSGALVKGHPVYWEGNQMSFNSPNGKLAFEKGIGVDSNTTLVFDVEGKNQETFEAYIGIDMAAPNKDYGGGESIFRIYKDGRMIYESPVMQRDDDCIYVNQNIHRAKEIQLEVQVNDNLDNPEAKYNGWADWADAKFVMEEQVGIIPSVINEDGVLDEDDLSQLQDVLLGRIPQEDSMVTVADMNIDGQLDIFDLILIKLKIESISDSE